MTIKRVVFLLTCLFLSIGLAASTGPAWSRASARLAAAAIIFCGFIGIVSGRHYATTNFYEPWAKVAEVVARDASSGATVVSRNPPFFLYLDYQPGLQGEVGSGFAHLGSATYATHGYKVLESDVDPAVSNSLHGKVVVVKGPSVEQEVESLDLLDAGLRRRCRLLGEYRAAPDPAAALKARFMHNVAVMTYRTDVLWYECP